MLQTGAAQDIVSCLATFAVLITRIQSYVQQLDRQKADLNQALQVKTTFLSHCSHELRTPLSANLVGFSSNQADFKGFATVLEDSNLQPAQRENLSAIISSGNDLLGLISDILDQTRLETGDISPECEPFSLRTTVESALDSMAAIAQGKGLEIRLVNGIKDEPPIMKGDAFRIKQVSHRFECTDDRSC